MSKRLQRIKIFPSILESGDPTERIPSLETSLRERINTDTDHSGSREKTQHYLAITKLKRHRIRISGKLQMPGGKKQISK